MCYSKNFCGGLLLLCGLCCQGTALADDECYVTVALGKSRVQGIKTSAEASLFDHRFVSGTYQINGTSRSSTFGIGCQLTDAWSIELDQRRGFRVSVDSRGTFMVQDRGSFDFHVRRFAEVEGYGITLLGRYPLSGNFWLTGRLGVLVGTERVGLTSDNIPGGWALVSEKEGYLPVAGAGLLWRKPNSKLEFAVERLWYSDGNKFGETKGGLRYRF